MLDSERYAEERACRYFGDTLGKLGRFSKLGRSVDQAIRLFPKEAANTAPNSRLVVYVKPEEGAWITKGPYWAFPSRPRGRFSISGLSATRRTKWLRHIPGRLTAEHIHQAREDGRRGIFERLDARMEALRSARASLTSALKRMRNLLACHGGPLMEGELDLPFPTILLPSADARMPRDLLFRLWRMLTRLARHDAALTDLVRTYEAAAPDRRIGIWFARDSKNRFGRILWIHASGSARCKLWSDLELRRLRVPYSARRKLFAFERERRSLVRSRRKLVGALHEISKSARIAVGNAERLLGQPSSPGRSPQPGPNDPLPSDYERPESQSRNVFWDSCGEKGLRPTPPVSPRCHEDSDPMVLPESR